MPWSKLTTPEGMPAWPPSQHPHQVFVMAGSVVSGVLGLTMGPSSDTIRALLDPWALVLWHLVLAGSGVAGVWAAVIARRDGLLSMLLERIALGVVGGFAAIYSVAALIAGGWGAVHIASMIGGYALACAARYAQVRATLRWLHEQADARVPRPDGPSPER